MREEREIRMQLVEYGKKLVRSGLVQGTWGNLSVRLDQHSMIVTPSGLDYYRLTPSDMVKVDIQSLRHEGQRKPTSEKGIHSGIYQLRPELGAVIHTHSKFCSIFAAARSAVPVEKNEETERIFGSRVELAAYALPGTEQLRENTLEAFGDNYGCIMAGHGMVCAGQNLEEAFSYCRRLEEYCRDYIEARL